jgi:hypothetical protein
LRRAADLGVGMTDHLLISNNLIESSAIVKDLFLYLEYFMIQLFAKSSHQRAGNIALFATQTFAVPVGHFTFSLLFPPPSPAHTHTQQ